MKLRLANPASQDDRAFIKKVLDDPFVRNGIVLAIKDPVIPTVDQLLATCFVLLAKDGFIAIHRYPGPYAAEAHLCFLPITDKRDVSVMDYCAEAMAWVFTETPIERIVARVLCSRERLLALALNTGMHVVGQDGDHLLLAAQIDDWAFVDSDLGLSAPESAKEVYGGNRNSLTARLLGALHLCALNGFASKGVRLYNRGCGLLVGKAPAAIVLSWKPLTVDIGGEILVLEAVDTESLEA